MGWSGNGEKKGKWSFKSLLSPGLRHRSFKRPGGGSRDDAPPLPLLAEVAAPPGGTSEGSERGASPSSPLDIQPGSDAGDSGPGGGVAAADAAEAPPGAHSFAGRSLVVRVLQARGLPAADSNGLSDPYCSVKVGSHKASSRTELKTLEPRWNETMCFAAADVADALEDGRPHVAFRVFDWDLVSADDFLGQCELPFGEVAAAQAAAPGPMPPLWLPLYGYARGGRMVGTGEIQVAAWFDDEAGRSQQGGSALSTLCCQPGARKQVPQVVHSSRGVLYEEPLIACLAVTLEAVEGVPLRSGTMGPGGGGADAAASLSRVSASRLSWRGEASPVAAGGRLLGRIFHRKRNSGGGGGRGGGGGDGRRVLQRLRSSISEDMVAGEDPGDEYGGLDFYERQAGGVVADAEASPGLEEDEEVPRELLHPDQAAARSPARSLDMTHASAMPGADGATGREASAGGLSGMRMYVRLVLGQQKQTSWIKKERANGAATWQQTFVFAAPLPLRDRQLRLELYRTASSTQRGRLISIAHVWLHELVPAGLSEDLEACRESSVELESVLKHLPGGRLRLRSTLVDTDQRRSMYRAPFLDSKHVAEGGGGFEDCGAVRGLDRLESATVQYSEHELLQRALHTEQSFILQERRYQVVHEATKSLGGFASSMAHHSWATVCSYVSSEQQVEAAPAAEGKPASVARPPPPPKLPEPSGSLALSVHSISLPAAASADCYFVLKCGPHWGRSRSLAMAGRSTAECEWQLSLPILDPTAILTLALFQQSRGRRASERLRPGFTSAPVMVGKLRVRLSCLLPNSQLTADLALLGERAKGAHEAGSVQLSLRTTYAGPVALFKGYAAPRLPAAAYAHGIDGKAYTAVMDRECRRIVLRWLDGANPAISAAEALTVLDAEREVFALSRTRVNLRRIRMALVGVQRAKRKFDAIKTWQEPWQSVAAMAGICLTCFLPRLAVPALLAWLVASTLASQPDFEAAVLRMEQDPPDIEPENESLETTTVNPLANLRSKLEKLQRMGLMVQNLLESVASIMERAGALLSWQDPAATLGVLCVLSVVALLIFFLGLPTVVSFVLCFVIRPPALRTPTPPLPVVVFGKLPCRGDRIV